MARTLQIGIDIGGTFTDFIAVDIDAGATYVWKTLTTPLDPDRAVVEGLQSLVAAHHLDFENVSKLVHATTLITNALIERKGAKTALLTTRGFADLLEIGREVRYDLYDIFLKMPEPLVPAKRRFEVSERVDYNGEVIIDLDDEELAGVAEQLQACGAESLAICFLHSYANPAHEQLAAAAIGDRLPDLPMSISSAVAGEIREYERFSTTTANAYVQPLASHYLLEMTDRLSDLGIPAPLQIMLSNGGTTTAVEAARVPVRLVESGPAAGALIASHYARMLDEPFVLAFDMGGTTAKLCAVENGQPTVGSGLEVARVHRFKRGSGLPIRAPSVELIEIGAGGGSIARIDELGLLTVGPDSAGAEPGPACYGLGGELPTVTDADLLLGYLNPDYFLGGEMFLDPSNSYAAISSKLRDHIDLETIEIAAGIHDVVNEMMSTAAGVYIAERGQDPRRYALVATGGAGPVHAVEVARKLGIGKVIIPPTAGVASAGGLLVAPPRLDFARSSLTTLDALDWPGTQQLFEEMESEALETLRDMGVGRETIAIQRSVDARYINQGHEIVVPIQEAIWDNATARQVIAAAFDAEYRRLFGRTVDGVAVECVTWRTTLRGQDGAIPVASAESTSGSDLPTYRPVYFKAANGTLDTPVYRRESLERDHQYRGPGIVEEAQSTSVIGPSDHFQIDRSGNIVIRVEGGGSDE